MNMHTSVSIGLTAVVLLGCGEAPVSGPPTLRLGHDMCAHCGMLLAEDRCAAASIAMVDGVPSYMMWDDVGCLLDWLREKPETAFTAHYVRDYDDRTWVEAPHAMFLMTEAIRTPMGSWIVAFDAAGDAESGRQRHGGAVCSWPELPDARKRWLIDEGRLPAP